MKQHLLIRIFSLGLLFLFWSGLAYYLDDPEILPPPGTVASQMATFWQQGKLQENLWATAIRVLAAFTLAMSIGTIVGYAMGRNEKLNAWLDVWLIVFLNLPALVLIVLCYLWIGLNETAAVLAVTLNKVPLVITLIREGARSSSSHLRELAQVYRLGYFSRWWNIILPELYPSLVGAMRGGLSVIWKIVLVVEFLGRSDGIGRQIHTQFSIFNVAGVMAYALSFVVLILMIEFLILEPLERRVNRWRDNVQA